MRHAIGAGLAVLVFLLLSLLLFAAAALLLLPALCASINMSMRFGKLVSAE